MYIIFHFHAVQIFEGYVFRSGIWNRGHKGFGWRIRIYEKFSGKCDVVLNRLLPRIAFAYLNHREFKRNDVVYKFSFGTNVRIKGS